MKINPKQHTDSCKPLITSILQKNDANPQPTINQ